MCLCRESNPELLVGMPVFSTLHLVIRKFRGHAQIVHTFRNIQKSISNFYIYMCLNLQSSTFDKPYLTTEALTSSRLILANTLRNKNSSLSNVCEWQSIYL